MGDETRKPKQKRGTVPHTGKRGIIMLDMRQIGKNIAELRRNCNMTQMELADRMGISFQAVSNWERGDSLR